MVSVQHSVANTDGATPVPELLAAGLGPDALPALQQAVEWAQALYAGRQLGSGEEAWQHALGISLIAVSLKLDLDARIAALLFAVPEYEENASERIAERFSPLAAKLVEGLRRLNRLHMVSHSNGTAADLHSQNEVLRKMVLALAEDIRVVLLRLASRVQTLRFFTANRESVSLDIARESMDLYAPLANRLGVWQLKWELEDLSFRFLEPDTYKRIAKQLDERRVEREAFITDSIARLKLDVAAIGVKAEVYGRPKHIYSIWNKMRNKHVDFDQVYDVRALRVLVDEVRDCYAVLSLVHELWEPIPKEFDDYILKPKGNNYQSLHTAVRAADGRAMEVQIRTYEMHRHAELGVAAHWRYKEGAKQGGGAYDEKISLLRQLLSWRDEVTDASVWEEHTRQAALDDTVYVATPQGRVIDLPTGATAIDFAYRLHTDLGHRCRGAKVDGQMLPLDRPLVSGQVVEIISAKQGGPSRDWLNPQLGYLVTSNARAKVRRWFVQQEEDETAAQGRAIVIRELQRSGLTQTNQEDLAAQLGFKDTTTFYLAVGRGDVSGRQIHNALQPVVPIPPAPELVISERRKAVDQDDRVLVVGVGRLLTQLARCCKPVPPDTIQGFVTRGRGVSIHREDCKSFLNLAHRHPERIVPAEWGHLATAKDARPEAFSLDIMVEAMDRPGLLRDISDVFTKDKLNVTGVNTISKAGRAHMRFTIEVSGGTVAQRVLQQIGEIDGVISAVRA
ncbi:RelA/SpoT family protein [Uliginosibacterium gangwonense]|uniref:RelA/SpoT family protein n=1 Tax=Uliginosibacterium gangwonense TaxID=392736 RepID=UPI000367F962|nr:bifunctional (p)ppGpp synthetase/guanosine-3',5'-bis(diphosphate) 3'-pyrophosphohydrolase [Uliginosibacterium gangwonense]